MSKFYITWDDFELALEELNQIAQIKEYDHIIGLSRGGLPIAVKLSNLTGIPMTPIVWQTRDGEEQDIVGLKKVMSKYQNILVVDDICDSGLTFSQIKQCLPNADYYALITKNVDDVNFATNYMEGDKRWIVFPWENAKEKMA